jgi:urease alpha subunit
MGGIDAHIHFIFVRQHHGMPRMSGVTMFGGELAIGGTCATTCKYYCKVVLMYVVGVEYNRRSYAISGIHMLSVCCIILYGTSLTLCISLATSIRHTCSISGGMMLKATDCYPLNFGFSAAQSDPSVLLDVLKAVPRAATGTGESPSGPRAGFCELHDVASHYSHRYAQRIRLWTIPLPP